MEHTSTTETEHKCPGCGRATSANIGDEYQHGKQTLADLPIPNPNRCRKLFAIGTLLLLIPALSPFWVGPLTHTFVSFPAATGGGSGAGWIIEEVGKRFLFASVSIASAMTGSYVFTSAIGLRVYRKPGI